MKRFLKFGAVLTALVLALTCFVACQNDDDNNNNDGPKTVAEYTSDNYKFEFKDDGNFNVYKNNSMTSNNMVARAAEQEWTLIASGTYTGDPTSETGTVTMTVKTVAETENDEKIKVGTYSLTGGTTITGTGENASITISVTKATENNTPADPDPDPAPDPDPDPDPQPTNELVGTTWFLHRQQGQSEDNYVEITLEFTSATQATYKIDAHPENEESAEGSLTGTYTVADEKVTFTITAVENADNEFIVNFMPKKGIGEVFEFTFSEEKAKLSITYKFTKNNTEREVTIDLAKQESQS